MTDPTLEQEARALYEARVHVAPRWEQLGDVTKGVWREVARAERDRRDGDLAAMLE